MNNLDMSLHRQRIYALKPILEMSCCSNQFISVALLAPLPKKQVLTEAKHLLLLRQR